MFKRINIVRIKKYFKTLISRTYLYLKNSFEIFFKFLAMKYFGSISEIFQAVWIICKYND